MNKYNNIPEVNINEHRERDKAFFELLKRKSSELNAWLQINKNNTDLFFARAIEWWKINAMIHKVTWDDIIEDILKDKLDYLSKKYEIEEYDAVDLFIEKEIVRFQIEQKNINAIAPHSNERYVSLLYRYLDETPIKIQKEPDKIKKVDIEIRAFKYRQEIELIMAKKIKVSKEDATKIFNQQIADFEKYIELLARKRNLLQTKIDTFQYLDQIDKVNDEIEVFNLKWEIQAKHNFIEHFRDRKQ